MCEKCGDRGFTEEEHGLVMVFCDCEAGKKLREDIIGVPDDSISGIEQKGGIVNDPELGIVRRIEPDNPNSGSPDTSKPKQHRKSKAKKKASKGIK